MIKATDVDPWLLSFIIEFTDSLAYLYLKKIIISGIYKESSVDIL